MEMEPEAIPTSTISLAIQQTSFHSVEMIKIITNLNYYVGISFWNGKYTENLLKKHKKKKTNPKSKISEWYIHEGMFDQIDEKKIRNSWHHTPIDENFATSEKCTKIWWKK